MENRKATKLTAKTLIVLIFAVLILALLLNGIRFLRMGKNEAKIVPELPTGYIAVDELSAVSNGKLECVCWEQQVSIVKQDSLVSIFQTDIKDSSFIVKYKGKHYINVEILKDNGTITPTSTD